MEGSAGRVRKGAWTHEEDDLLRKCIEKFGEEKWHQIPHRAGLNRCRKSCRLRWLNYLKPNIKRGEFTEDEVDMILRLHKLLGNRWSLIAGRLPGRTANDVKNYWNTHLRKKTHVSSSRKDWKTMNCSSTQNTQKINVIKPQPWTFSKKTLSVLHKKTDSTSIDIGSGKNHMYAASSSSSVLDTPDNEIMWWERLLQSSELVQETPASMGWSDGGTTTTAANIWAEKPPLGGTDFVADLWNFLTTEEETVM